MTDTIPDSRRAKALLDFLALGGWFEASNIREADEALAAFGIFFEQCDPLTAFCENVTKPEWYSDNDGDFSGNWDHVADMHNLEPGQIIHLYGARHVSDAFVANVPVPDEDDGQYKLFATREEAEKAIAEAKQAAA